MSTICKHFLRPHLCRSQFLEHRPHCRSEMPLRSVDRGASDRTFHRGDAIWKFCCSRPKKLHGQRLKILSTAYWFGTIPILLRISLGEVVPGLLKEPWFRRLSARASTTVPSHTSCSPISQRIIVTLSGCLPSVRYSQSRSSIEGKSRSERLLPWNNWE